MLETLGSNTTIHSYESVLRVFTLIEYPHSIIEE